MAFGLARSSGINDDAIDAEGADDVVEEFEAEFVMEILNDMFREVRGIPVVGVEVDFAESVAFFGQQKLEYFENT